MELIRYEGAGILEVDLLVSGVDLNELGGGAHKVEKGTEKGVKRQESLSLKKEKQGNINIQEQVVEDVEIQRHWYFMQSLSLIGRRMMFKAFTT